MDKELLKFEGIKLLMFNLSLLTAIQVSSIIVQATMLAAVISALFAGSPLQEQGSRLGLFLLAFLIRQGTVFVQQKLTYSFAEKTGSTLRKRLIAKLFRLGPRYTKAEGTGTIVTLVLEGLAQFRTYLELFLPRMIATAIVPATIVIYIWTQDKIAAVILILTMPILIVFLILVGLAARKQSERQWRSYRVLSNHFVDSLRGLETLKFLGRSRSHSKTIARVSDSFRSATMRTLRVAFLSSFALDFFTMLSVASVAVSLGLRLINGNLTLMTGLTVLILAPEYFLPVRMVGADYHATLNGKEAGKAMQAILEEELPKEQGMAAAERPYDGLTADSSALAGGLTWTKDSSLILSTIDVQREPDSPPSLNDVTMQLQGLGRIGLVGESGAGKSTLIDVLGGFLQPTGGTITLNGHTLPTLSLDAWREQITYIPQQPYIFNCSFTDNIRFYHPDASLEEVERAVQAAGLTELAQSLPHGLDELLGNGGRALSGGQEQRVALARAFLSKRPVILLDEPTAHLDIETELELKQTMLAMFSDRLMILATHRLHWMRDMDQIVVLERGRLVEAGTHEQLLDRKGRYFDMLQTEWEGI